MKELYLAIFVGGLLGFYFLYLFVQTKRDFYVVLSIVFFAFTLFIMSVIL